MKMRYWIVIVLLSLVVADWVIRAPDSRSRQLSGAIEAQASAKLKIYPYKFRVLKVDGETAYLSTPRNVQVPAFRMLSVLYPEINTKDPNDPAFIAAEQLLGEVQSEARAIVQGQPGVKDVRWELDRDWLATHYIDVPGK
jgi:hypothetical protein